MCFKIESFTVTYTKDRELGMPVPKCMLVFLTGEAYRRLRSNHTLDFFQTC